VVVMSSGSHGGGDEWRIERGRGVRLYKKLRLFK